MNDIFVVAFTVVKTDKGFCKCIVIFALLAGNNILAHLGGIIRIFLFTGIAVKLQRRLCYATVEQAF